VDKSVASPAHRALAAMLREVRAERGMSQTEVARALGVPQSFVSKYESGVRRLDLVELHALASAFGTDLTALVARFEEMIRHAG